MLKLNASYSKKVPADGEYTSQSYHASIEVELPDGLNQNQLNQKIHDTFELVRNSVENELHGTANAPVQQNNQPQAPVQTSQPFHPNNNAVQNNGNNNAPASPKQIGYLMVLAKQHGINAVQLAAQYGVDSVEHLSRKQCSELINQWKVA